MGTTMNKVAYIEVIEDDIKWLEGMSTNEYSLEMKHIVSVLRGSIDMYYPELPQDDKSADYGKVVPPSKDLIMHRDKVMDGSLMPPSSARLAWDEQVEQETCKWKKVIDNNVNTLYRDCRGVSHLHKYNFCCNCGKPIALEGGEE